MKDIEDWTEFVDEVIDRVSRRELTMSLRHEDDGQHAFRIDIRPIINVALQEAVLVMAGKDTP